MNFDRKKIKNDAKNFINSDEIYYNSNEKLNIIYNNFDFNGKNILSVLGSGDQAFNLINRGAKKVDLFDRNKMTIYFFYLRKWIIEYLNMYYYKKNLNSNFIKDLLKIVTPKSLDEEIALYFWRYLVRNNLFGDCEDAIFSRDSEGMKDNNIRNLSKIKRFIKQNDFLFRNIDITEDISIDEKYDYLILSNISEWLCYSDYDKIWKFTNNIFDLLDNDGIAICSTLWVDDCDGKVRDIFKRKFDICTLKKKSKFKYSGNYYPGYYLVKK